MNNMAMWFYVHPHGHNTGLSFLFKTQKLYYTISLPLSLHLMKHDRGSVYGPMLIPIGLQ